MFPAFRFSAIAVALSAAVLLSGCGGGGGGGGNVRSPTDRNMPPAGATSFKNLPTGAATNAAAAIGRAADTRPRAGSVTQSSNAVNGITTDSITATAQYGASRNSYSVSNGSSWSIGSNDGNPRSIPDVTAPFKGSELNKGVSGGTLYVDVYSDIEAPTSVTTGGTYDFTFSTVSVGGRYINRNSSVRLPAELDGVSGTASCTGCSFVYTTGQLQMTAGSMTFTPSDGSGASTLTAGTAASMVADADYLAGGVWLFVPSNAASAADYVFGAFADGSDPFRQSNLAALQGAATYEGEATGVYSQKSAQATEIGYFDGDATLTANFGDASSLGTISGRITNFEVDGEREAGRLDLGRADIGSSNSGFFEGSVTGSDDERSYSGRWGGQFYGNGEADGKPGSVAGTFGGKSADGAVNFVGAFGAHKQ